MINDNKRRAVLAIFHILEKENISDTDQVNILRAMSESLEEMIDCKIRKETMNRVREVLFGKPDNNRKRTKESTKIHRGPRGSTKRGARKTTRASITK